jgi:hypothetical protein
MWHLQRHRGRNIPALHQRSSACLTVFNIRSLRQHNGICCGILTRRIDHRRPDRPGLYQSTGSRCARSRMGGVLCWSTPVELLNLSSASIFAGGLLPYEAAASVCYRLEARAGPVSDQLRHGTGYHCRNIPHNNQSKDLDEN